MTPSRHRLIATRSRLLLCGAAAAILVGSDLAATHEAFAQQSAPPANGTQTAPPAGGGQNGQGGGRQRTRGQDQGGQAPQQDGGNGGNGGNGGGRGQRGGGGGGGNMFGRGGFGRGGGGMGLQQQFREAFEPDFVRRDIPLMKEQLGLEEAQMAVVEQLMRDYEDAFEPAKDEIQQQLQDTTRQMMAPMMNPQMQEKWGNAMRRAREQMEQMAAEKGSELTQEERQQFFRTEMTRLGEEVQKEMKASGAFDEMRATLGTLVSDFNKWQETKARLRKTFIDGTQASLSDAQTKKWPAFERFLAREKTLPRGTISGENVNLFIVLDESGLSKETFEKLHPIMDEYELQLDQALKTRNDFLAANEAKYLEAVQKGDQEAAKRFAQRAIDLREKVRDVNDRYREAICAQLSEADAARVRRAALASAYERVYRQSSVERAFEAALKIEGLESGVLDSLKSLQTQYAGEIGPVNERIVQAMRKEEPVQQQEEMVRVVGFLTGDVPVTQMFRGPGGGGPGGAESETRQLMDKRSATNETYIERIKALLTPEQFEALPKSRDTNGPGGGMFGGNGPIRLADLPDNVRQRMERFDKNKDGTLDDAERQAMREEFGNGGGGGGGGGNGGGGRGGRGQRGGGGGGGGGGNASN
jgi:hypothetical protein